MAEWFKAAVLKTVESLRAPGVRIPLSPPSGSFQASRGMEIDQNFGGRGS